MAFRPTIPAYSTQGKSFSRTAAFPLEGYEIWTDLEALKAYAANTDASKDPSYIGQKVAYVDYENNRVVHYGIEIDGTLKELGADKMGVEALTAKDDGKIPKAFKVVDTPASGEERAEDYQPEVSHIEIRWVTPEAFEDTNTVTTVKSSDGSISVTETKSSATEKEYDIKVDLSDYATKADLDKKLNANGWVDNKDAEADGWKFERAQENEETVQLASFSKDGLTYSNGEYDTASVTASEIHLQDETSNTNIGAGIIELSTSGIGEIALTAEKISRELEQDTFNYQYPEKSGTLAVKEDLVDYTVSVTTTDVEDSVLKHYVFNQCGKEIAHIDIPKDLVVESGTVVVKAESGAWGDAGTYIELVIANQSTPIYINVKDLIDIYTVDDTSTIDMTIDGTKITADVKISKIAGNSLEAKDDGLYVNAPTLPTSEDKAVDNQYVTAVDQKDGKITVSRKQISYNELADLPTIPGSTDFGVMNVSGEDAISVEDGNDEQYKVVKLTLDSTNPGNVELSQSESGLKANIDLSEYAKTAEIPDIVINTATDKTYADTAPDTDKVIMALAAEGHTITPTALEVVTKAGWDKINNAGEGQTAVRLISQSEIDKLAKLNLDNGEITISGSVNASQVKALYDTVVNIVKGSTSDLDPDTEGDQLGLGIEKNAQENKIESIGLPDATLDIVNKHISIPAAIKGKYGVIKGGDPEVANEVSMHEGVGKVVKVSTDSLVNGNEEFILYGGNAGVKAQS